MSGETSNTESNKNNLLLQPCRKKNFGFPKCYPLPIVRDSFCSGETNAPWNCVIGHIKGHSVEVSNESDMELLFTQGFFGTGTLSRSTPQVVEKKFREKIEKKEIKKECEQSQCDSSSILFVDSNDSENDENPTKRLKKDEVVLSDTTGSSTDATDTSNDATVMDIAEEDFSSLSDVASATSKTDEKEALQLSLEEAFFLSYGLGVLIVKDKDQPLDLMRLWQTFCDIHPNKNFPVMYTAYHHFRSKGWIVRSGMKYGCDFVLYKDGLPFYHSTYAVLVKPVKEKNFRDVPYDGRSNLTWSSLAAIHRICSHSSKGVLILYVIKPASVAESKISTPFCISQFQVEEVLVKKWVPSEEQRLDS